ncbi:efflux RND transporter periplasmic adaptor subunit [Gulosibacter sp. 10]|uniref:efflux RND transporter periplasmic adaptor subunit n=1 Tax=Gulosibacter sp. 10 TaxID=1255570 RepID=UPI00097EFE91|nr:efflux RND transporter periplasmic adaptor subunit [Gulosibacter sp. 10]SJM71492.1 Membrane-fusion protein [Gulosibacter sp. 10]
MTSSGSSIRTSIGRACWFLVAAVIAAALVKLAFFNAREGEALEPSGSLEAPVVTVERSTVVNSFPVSGAVTADPGVPIRATEQGAVTEVYVADGATVQRGDTLFEVREEIGQTEPVELTPGDPEEGVEPEYSEPEPIYQYYAVTAPASGIVSGFSPLPKMTVSVGEEVGQIGPGTFTVVADLTAAMQYRMLDEPATATVAISGGPAPFECTSLEIGAPEDQDPAAPQQNAPADPYADPYMDPYADPYAQGGDTGSSTVTGQIRCAVPEDERVFAGLTAEVEVTAGMSEDVLVVPVTAVRGDYATGVVYVPAEDGGEPLEVAVELGLTDGLFVEVVSGLEEGQTVLEYVPAEVPVYDEFAYYEEDFG